MPAGLLSDLNNIGHSLYGDVTSVVGGFLNFHKTKTHHNTHHNPHTATATSTFATKTSIHHSSPITHITTSSHATPTSTVSSLSSLSSSSAFSSHTPSSSLLSTSTISPSITSSATPSATPTPTYTHGNQLYFISLLFVCAIIMMLVLTCSAPVIIRSFKFGINFIRIFFSRNGTFYSDYEAGLNSDAFALQENIDREDRRHGLDKNAKLRILWYMFWYEEPFDEARLRYVMHQFALNGIGEDGQPLDPKFVRTH